LDLVNRRHSSHGERGILSYGELTSGVVTCEVCTWLAVMGRGGLRSLVQRFAACNYRAV
jgi:hypothetical protein